MFKTRIKRFKNLRVDMTAMCDVAFLLLLFFISVSKFKHWEPMNVNPPGKAARSIDDFMEGNYSIILISKDNKVMYQMPDKIRDQTLKAMCAKYNLEFSANDVLKFTKMDVVGTPLSGLKFYINNYYDQQQFYDRTGIPYAGDNSELANWILESRKVDNVVLNRSLRIVIKADKDVKYPQIQKVISILQHQKINKFSLMTAMKYDR